jgi:hypothetical protein
VFEIEAPGAGHGENSGIAGTEAIHRYRRIAGDGDRGGEDRGGEAQAGQGDQKMPEPGLPNSAKGRNAADFHARIAEGPYLAGRKRAEPAIAQTYNVLRTKFKEHKFPFCNLVQESEDRTQLGRCERCKKTGSQYKRKTFQATRFFGRGDPLVN